MPRVRPASRPRRWWAVGKQFTSYALLGGVGALTDFLLFTALVHLGLAHLPSNVASVGSGIAVSYLLNSRYTFARVDHRVQRVTRFFAVGLVGLGVSTAMLVLLVDGVGLPSLVAKLITLPVIAISQFAANRSWTFGHIAP
ncbi:GtrA family protein [Georgenia sp. AZ-5]|uniref:GtrA family protein n=1 Tax=Georgenia sp. AZ-5 TaxID=3367526 RepID=UPI003754E145